MREDDEDVTQLADFVSLSMVAARVAERLKKRVATETNLDLDLALALRLESRAASYPGARCRLIALDCLACALALVTEQRTL